MRQGKRAHLSERKHDSGTAFRSYSLPAVGASGATSNFSVGGAAGASSPPWIGTATGATHDGAAGAQHAGKVEQHTGRGAQQGAGTPQRTTLMGQTGRSTGARNAHAGGLRQRSTGVMLICGQHTFTGCEQSALVAACDSEIPASCRLPDIAATAASRVM
jgi:hypothetical protein